MNPIRMTVEELTELLKSGPVELECDDGRYKDSMLRITIVYIHKEKAALIDSEDIFNVLSFGTGFLSHYPSKKAAPIVKRYWIWSFQLLNGNWYKSDIYSDDKFIQTNGKMSIGTNDKMAEIKHENEWIELDENGKLVNWAGKV